MCRQRARVRVRRRAGRRGGTALCTPADRPAGPGRRRRSRRFKASRLHAQWIFHNPGSTLAPGAPRLSCSCVAGVCNAAPTPHSDLPHRLRRPRPAGAGSSRGRSTTARVSRRCNAPTATPTQRQSSCAIAAATARRSQQVFSRATETWKATRDVKAGKSYAACLPRWGTKRISTRRLRALAMRRSIEKECPA